MSPNRTTFPEALIVIATLGVLALQLWSGHMRTWQDIWLFGGLLAVIVVFYFALLLCRAIHHFMIGNDHFWWEKYEERDRKEWEKRGK